VQVQSLFLLFIEQRVISLTAKSNWTSPLSIHLFIINIQRKQGASLDAHFSIFLTAWLSAAETAACFYYTETTRPKDRKLKTMKKSEAN